MVAIEFESKDVSDVGSKGRMFESSREEGPYNSVKCVRTGVGVASIRGPTNLPVTRQGPFPRCVPRIAE